jgi:hypothetical protein
MGFIYIIDYTEANETVRVYYQRYLVATLDDTNKVERLALLCGVSSSYGRAG